MARAIDPNRALAKAAGAAQRAYAPAVQLMAATQLVGGTIAAHGVAVVEALDLLRFYLREMTLRNIIEPAPQTRLQRPKRPAASVTARKVPPPPAKPTAAGKKGRKA